MIEPPPGAVRRDWQVMADYLERLDAALRVWHDAQMCSSWELNTSGTVPAPDAARQSIKSGLLAVFGNRELLDALADWSRSDRLSSVVRRELTRLRDRAVRFSIDFDPEVCAVADEIDRIDTHEAGEIRRRARKAVLSDADPAVQQAIGQELLDVAGRLAPKLIELFTRKELLARQAGHPGYAALAVRADGFEPSGVSRALAYVDRATQAEWQSTLAELPVRKPPFGQVDLLLRRIDGPQAIDLLPNRCAEIWGRLQARFAPYLDEVQFHHGDLIAGGMCMVLHWPDDVRIGLRDRSGDAGEGTLDAKTFVVLMHEVGHALHYRLLAEHGASFRDFFCVPPAVDEGLATAVERLAFEEHIWRATGREAGEASAFRRPWSRSSLWLLRQQLGRVRFEREAYRLALESPGQLGEAWASFLSESTGTDLSVAHWAIDGHGFYTEDPMRRYAYVVAVQLADALVDDRPVGEIGSPVPRAGRVFQTFRRLIHEEKSPDSPSA